MSLDDPIAAFRVEASELLDQVEQGLLDLTHRLDDANLVNAVFRGLHTLKGSGAMFGFDALAGFTHHCESVFDRSARASSRRLERWSRSSCRRATICGRWSTAMRPRPRAMRS